MSANSIPKKKMKPLNRKCCECKNPAMPGYVRCSRCHELRLRRIRDIQSCRRKHGLCVACDSPATHGQYCKKHYRKALENQSKYYRRKRPAVQKKRGYWNQETIIQALREHFTATPTMKEFEEKKRGNPEIPSQATIIHYFGKGGLRKSFKLAKIKEEKNNGKKR